MRPRQSRGYEHHCGILREVSAEQVRTNLFLILRPEADPLVLLARGLPSANRRSPEDTHAKIDNPLHVHSSDTRSVEDDIFFVSMDWSCPSQQLAKPEPVPSPVTMPHHPIFTVVIESLFALGAEQVLRRLERGLPSHLGGQEYWIWMAAVIGGSGARNTIP